MSSDLVHLIAERAIQMIDFLCLCINCYNHSKELKKIISK